LSDLGVYRALAKRIRQTPVEGYERNRLALKRKDSRTSPMTACWVLSYVCLKRALPLTEVRVEISAKPFRLQM
jgi:hypothetical protein